MVSSFLPNNERNCLSIFALASKKRSDQKNKDTNVDWFRSIFGSNENKKKFAFEIIWPLVRKNAKVDLLIQITTAMPV